MSAATIVLAVVVGSQIPARSPQYEHILRLPSAEDVLYAGNGLLYAGTEAGGIEAYEPIRSTKVGGAPLTHPVRYIAAYGDHVFAAGNEDISRLSPSLGEHITSPLDGTGQSSSITGLAAGPLGVWAIDSSHRRLIHFSSRTLKPIRELPLPVPVHGLAVSAGGVWALAHGAVLLIKPRHGVWTTTRIGVTSEPRAIATEHNRAVVLCTATSDVYVLIDRSGELERLFKVTRRGLGIGLDGGDLWVMAPGDDLVAKYSLRTGEQEGERVPIGVGGAQLAVDQQAVWIGESSNAIDRLDKGQLTLTQSARHSARRARFILIPIWAWCMLAGVIVGICSMLIVFKRQTDPNTRIPRYWPPQRLIVFMVNQELLANVASAPVSTRTRTKRKGGELSRSPIALQAGESHTASRQHFPQAMHVRETILRLEKLNLLYRGFNYVPGVAHNGIRFSEAAPPSAQDLAAHFGNAAGRLCLIAGGSWLVDEINDDPGIVTFTLSGLIDQTILQSRQVIIPAHLRPRFRVDVSTMMLPIAHARCIPGTRVALDVIAQALPDVGDHPPRLDLVVAWQGTELVGTSRTMSTSRSAKSARRRQRVQ